MTPSYPSADSIGWLHFQKERNLLSIYFPNPNWSSYPALPRFTVTIILSPGGRVSFDKRRPLVEKLLYVNFVLESILAYHHKEHVGTHAEKEAFVVVSLLLSSIAPAILFFMCVSAISLRSLIPEVCHLPEESNKDATRCVRHLESSSTAQKSLKITPQSTKKQALRINRYNHRLAISNIISVFFLRNSEQG